jgi:hypothetical protein
MKERLANATGAVGVIAIFVGNSLATHGTSGSNRPTAAQVASDLAYVSHHALNQVGELFELTGLLLLVAFVARLWVVLRDLGELGTAGALAVMAGVLMLTIKIGSAAPAGAAMLDRQLLSPNELLLLSDINAMAFVLSWIPAGLWVAALACTSLSGRIGRIVGVLAGTGAMVSGALGQDPGKAFFLPFLVCLLWLLVFSARLAVKGRAFGLPRVIVAQPA